jgi:hypothetical protein
VSRPPVSERWQVRLPLWAIGVALAVVQWRQDGRRDVDPGRRRIRLVRNIGQAALEAWVISRYARLHRRR